MNLQEFLDEARKCERCGWAYGNCIPGYCSRTRTVLRPGRTEGGGFIADPFAQIEELKRDASDWETENAILCEKLEGLRRADAYISGGDKSVDSAAALKSIVSLADEFMQINAQYGYEFETNEAGWYSRLHDFLRKVKMT